MSRDVVVFSTLTIRKNKRCRRVRRDSDVSCLMRRYRLLCLRMQRDRSRSISRADNVQACTPFRRDKCRSSLSRLHLRDRDRHSSRVRISRSYLVFAYLPRESTRDPLGSSFVTGSCLIREMEILLERVSPAKVSSSSTIALRRDACVDFVSQWLAFRDFPKLWSLAVKVLFRYRYLFS